MTVLHEYLEGLSLKRIAYSVAAIRHINEPVTLYYDSIPINSIQKYFEKFSDISIILLPASI
jgi:hypothetical protein